MNKQHKISYDYYGDTRDIFSIVKDSEWPVFLCSNHDKFQDERYDILSANPIEKIIAHDNKTTVENKSGIQEYKDDPIDVVGIIMKKYPSDISDLPFTGGAIGYLSYDLGNHYEGIKIKKNDINVPLMAFGIYDWAVIVDHHKKNTTLIYSNEDSFINKIKSCLEKKIFDKNQEKKFSINSVCESNITHDEYENKFNKIQSYIQNGDCYQINFSQRFSAQYSGDTWDIYNKITPSYSSPYSAYIDMPFVKIMSFSPERFLSYDGNIVETKPIKGTRPVSNDIQINKQLIEELSASYKERAENLMIVDLLRNDLGKNCEFGSVKVKELFSIETFANVHHLVSTIQGKIAGNSNIYKLIKDCFPGGSITGAPKIRAMQIISELEPNNRNIYCGSIGYISFSGTTDLNIAIRTVMATKDKLYFWGGGGIVYDSEVESEYKETFDKIKPLLNLLKNSV
jgi:para-aminobenzoate synthetase component 1